jgi:20S proteasome alpha/beta subunit
MQSVIESPHPTALDRPPLENDGDQGYCLRAEEINSMTFQVGLFGIDGIVLASDRRTIHFGGVRDASDQDKIVPVEPHHLVYAYSGDECAQRAGRNLETRLERGFDHSDMPTSLEEIGNATYALESKRKGWNEKVNRKVMIAFYGSRLQLWVLDIKEQSVATSNTLIVAGDYQNTARFFTEHYYEQEKTVEQLKFLAIHSIRMGHLRNTALVGRDIDMVVCVRDELRRIGSAEINRLKDRSADLEREIRDKLFAVPS